MHLNDHLQLVYEPSGFEKIEDRLGFGLAQSLLCWWNGWGRFAFHYTWGSGVWCVGLSTTRHTDDSLAALLIETIRMSKTSVANSNSGGDNTYYAGRIGRRSPFLDSFFFVYFVRILTRLFMEIFSNSTHKFTIRVQINYSFKEIWKLK